jgi:hypothetical protein
MHELHVSATTVSPTSDTTTIPTTNEPTTTTPNDFLITENVSTTTTEEDTTETSTITDERSITPIGSQSTSTAATIGIIAGVAISGILTGALITVLLTLIIVLAIAKLTKKKQSMLSLLAMNQLNGEEADTIKDVGAEMKKDIEEPVYSVVLPNPVAGNDNLMDNMKKNECYGTLRA